jgi:hypothetical protein
LAPLRFAKRRADPSPPFCRLILKERTVAK